MRYPASDFKAHCLRLIDRVRETAQPITITKRGRVVARLVPASDDDERPWLRLKGSVRWNADPFAPVVGEDEIEALR